MLKWQMPTTDPQSELLTQVDENNAVIGGVPRGKAHETKAIYYRTIFVLVKNRRDEILVQKRSATKDLHPNCWDLSVGGHVNFGQSYLQTARRELAEELGIKANKRDLKFKGEVLVKLAKSNEYFHVFEYMLKNGDKVSIEKEEISSIDWLTINQIKKSMKDKTMKWYARPEQVVSALY